MATKKQKREAALARREEFLEQERLRGLEAQRQAKREENEKLQAILQRNREIDESFFGQRDVLDSRIVRQMYVEGFIDFLGRSQPGNDRNAGAVDRFVEKYGDAF